MKNEVTRVETNANGVEIHDNGTFWSITKPIKNAGPKAPQCNVYHVGDEKYIKAKWNKTYCLVDGRVDNSLIVY